MKCFVQFFAWKPATQLYAVGSICYSVTPVTESSQKSGFFDSSADGRNHASCTCFPLFPLRNQEARNLFSGSYTPRSLSAGELSVPTQFLSQKQMLLIPRGSELCGEKSGCCGMISESNPST